MKRDGFIFYRSFYDAVKDLDAEEFKASVSAICEYALNDEIKEETALSRVILALVKPQIDKNKERYINGCKGGAPKGNSNAKKTTENNQEQPKTTENNQKQPKDKDKVKDKDNDNDKDIIERSALSDGLKVKLSEWVEYKKSRREGYKPQGLKVLINQVEKQSAQSGESAVIELIDKSIANGYKGIIWDKIQSHKPITNFHAMDMRHNYSFDERALL